MMLSFYRWLTVALTPLLKLYLRQRQLRGKEEASRVGERWGYASLPRPVGGVVWVHAASVGESNSALPFIKRLLDSYPQANVLLTTGTVTSAQVMEAKLPDRAYHQFIPIDQLFAVRRFLKHWRPDAALLIESEIWPNLLMETRKRNIPLALINGRMSQRSYHQWNRLPRSIRTLVRCFDVIFPQSTEDTEKFRHFGARALHMVGNIKHDSPPLPADSREMAHLLQQVGDRPVWVAASTHQGEESTIAEVHQQLQEDFPELLTIIAPRHPHRGTRIAEDIRTMRLSVALRSAREPIEPSTHVYIADTLGELGLFYRMASIVFVGGSLVPHGGQNPLEPARLDCALISGPHTDNFAAICAEFEKHGALRRVHSAKELAEEVRTLLRDQNLQESLAMEAQKLASGKHGIMDTLFEQLAPLLEKSLAAYPAPRKRQEDTQ